MDIDIDLSDINDLMACSKCGIVLLKETCKIKKAEYDVQKYCCPLCGREQW